ncbi:MAG: hypothetical protein A2939_04930 [Parcubacteria group bacterium RIFCSPLOWO2_01_FULL_48_18]|nr:MAG: hypothetical protein A2939_04930 [Parcubacteria group bacterium RIFCSPLOWO2_01_FULL_48_18]
MERKREKQPGDSRIEEFVYDWKYRQFPQVVEYRGVAYDSRNDKGTSCVYRMIAENRMELPEPSYIEVDRDGRVLQEWD